MSSYHIPVLLKEVLKYLDIKQDHWYIDCNLGGGGHTEAILKAGGKVLGIDLDPDAINEVAQKYQIEVKTIGDHLEAVSANLILHQSNFANLADVVKSHELEKIQGILFDLGVSSHQLETGERGFSFNTDAPLDMRMNPTQGATATDLVNGLYEKELSRLFWEYGEENFAKPIARRIVEYRNSKKIETTDELAKIILSVRHRTPSDRTHPATRIFQALRIAVNDELRSLEEVLPQAVEVLAPHGRLVIISFHSLEDRIVKKFFNKLEQENKLKILTDKPIIATDEEVEFNVRSHSGKLRVAEKI